jgi:hypothetical protein
LDANDFPVDCYAASIDHQFRGAPGGNACRGDDLLQTLPFLFRR